jgi:hypothetical protein
LPLDWSRSIIATVIGPPAGGSVKISDALKVDGCPICPVTCTLPEPISWFAPFSTR